MARRTSRRQFIGTTMQAGLGGLAAAGLLPQLEPVAADEAILHTDHVKFSSDIEPVVRMLEDTPRDQLMESVSARIRHGLSYREILAALLLAGVRNVQPRPHVGFKFHAVLVVNSAHLASISSPDSDRWLPIFWALDYFKVAQARDTEEGDWTMSAVDGGRLPGGSMAKAEFEQAMAGWDVEAADRAVSGWSRTAGMSEIFELLFRYGARDLRDIGHKAIFVANSYRTLQCIGWQYAEPVLRSLTYALLNHSGEPNPGQSDLAADRPWRDNQASVADLPPDWANGRVDEGVTRDLLAALRRDSTVDATNQARELLQRGFAPQSIWDAIFLSAGELLMQQPGIISLHALTSTNALNYAFRTTADHSTRQLLMLQNIAFICHFRDRLGRQAAGDLLSHFGNDEASGGTVNDPATLFSQLRSQPLESAKRTYAYLQRGGNPVELINAVRRFIFLKGTDSHDYKFSSAVLEDYFHISPRFRDRYLAAATFKLRGADEPDNALVHRIRAALSPLG